MNNDLEKIAQRLLLDISKEARVKWTPNSKYISFRNLQIDKRGSFGERLFLNVLTLAYPRRIEYKDGDSGDWDLKINKMKFEVKTSSLDVNDKFQNEGLKKEAKITGFLFLGIAPNQLYIKFVNKNDVPWNKLHCREYAKTGVGYKWDHKIKDMLPVFNNLDIENEFKRVFDKEV